MTCAEAAEIFERVVAERKARSHVKPAMRYRQMERIAGKLRQHPDEDRFDADVTNMLPDLDSFQLMQMEFAMMSWWPERS